MKLQVLLCLVQLTMSEEASKEGLCAPGACDLPASDAHAALQVKKVAESQGDPKKIYGTAIKRFHDGTSELDIVYEDGTWVKDETLVPVDTPALVQDLQGNEGLPWKIWKIKKVKEALEGRRRHPTSTTTTTTTTTTATTTTTTTSTDPCLFSSVPDCDSGDFTFAFENLNLTLNDGSLNDHPPGTVTGCISGLSCGNETAVATSVRVVSNTAGYGLVEYVGGDTFLAHYWNVSSSCELQEFVFVSITDGIPGLANESTLYFFKVPPGATVPTDGDTCVGLSASPLSVLSVCRCEAKLTFKYNDYQ